VNCLSLASSRLFHGTVTLRFQQRLDEPRTWARRPSSIASNQSSKSKPSAEAACVIFFPALQR